MVEYERREKEIMRLVGTERLIDCFCGNEEKREIGIYIKKEEEGNRKPIHMLNRTETLLT
jgi:hypothetical protein